MRDAAEMVLEARAARRMLAPLTALADEAAGYAAQLAVAERMGAVPPAGFKIGATTKQMQDYLGLAGPLGGFVPASGVQSTPGRYRFADFVAPGVECEVGVRLARDLPPGPCSRAAAEASVGDVFAAIEIVDKRYADMSALHVPTLVADQVFHAAGVTGAPVPGWRALNLGAVRGRMSVAGTLRGEGVGADLLGHPMAALAWLAGSGAAAAFGGLKAGQVVFLGSVTPPIWLDGPCTVVVEFDGLGRAEVVFA